jgi:serine/threonine protein kinase/tetratricopeptide (TPR) repeat protein
MVGETISHYRVRRQIGAGGMGVVYLAYDERLEREVAIKVLPAGMLTDESARRRFRREALTLSRLNHPNVATIFDFDSEKGSDFLVTEFISGHPLDERLKQGPLPPREVVALGIQLAQGLAAAHAQGVVHRDLKPANMRFTPDGRLKILDFGLAQLVHFETEATRSATLTTSQQISGTLPYMAPEQLRGEAADARCDIWATGAVLYEMATGKRPFPETNGPLLIDAILNRNPPRPSTIDPKIPPGLENVILKALDKDPANRYASASDLGADLERLSAGTSPLAKSQKRNWIPYAIALAILILGAAIGFFATRHPAAPRTSSDSSTSRRSVAVLGFKNLSGRSDTAWLSTALSEMLTTELGAGEKILTISGENVARVKSDLSLPETDTLAPDTLARVRKNLGSDFVVLGSYLDLGAGRDDQIRLDLRLQDATAGQTIAVVSAKGTEAQLDELITRAGAQLRDKLGIGDVPLVEAAAVKASLPSNVAASRLYSEGLEKLRHFDVLAARDLLLKAAAADPKHAPTFVALSSAWNALGYDAKALEAAKQAFDLSQNLSPQERLLVQGQYYEASNQSEKAIASYRALFGKAPDNLDYGLRLANAQISGGKASDALLTIAKLRKLPSPEGDDLRIDLAETRAAHWLSDFKHEHEIATHIVEQGEKQGARLLVARARLSQCSASRNLGDVKGAIPACQEAQRISDEAGDRFGVATALNNIGNALYDQGDLPGARKSYEQVVEIDRALGNQGGVAGALDNIASVAGDQGDDALAKKLSQQALAIYRSTGDKINIAATLNNIGAELVTEGKFVETQKAFEESLAIGREIGSTTAVATALVNLGDTRLALGNTAGSRQAYEESLAMFEKAGEKSKSAYPMVGLGDVLTATGDLAGAKSRYEHALSLTAESGEKHETAIALSGLGTVLMNEGDLAQARKNYENALSIRNEIGEKESASDSLLDLARLSIEDGHPSDAQASITKALPDIHAQKSTDREALAHAILALAYLDRNKLADAKSHIAVSLRVSQKTQHRGIAMQIGIAAARVQAASGKSSAVAAVNALNALIHQAEQYGFVGYAFDARLAEAQAEQQAGQTATARDHLAALQKDSASRAFHLAATKAAKALGS